jgi:hypothetical protein
LQPIAVKDPADPTLELSILSSSILFSTRTTGMRAERGYFQTPNIARGQWHHLVATYDGSEMRAYLDGIVSPMTYSQTGPIEWEGGAFYLGWLDPYYFDGKIDEFRVYSRSLTEREILAHYRKMRDAEVDIQIGLDPASVADIVDALIDIRGITPNPSHGWARIQYAVRERSPVDLSIFDATGRKVRRLITRDAVEPGLHEVVWDGRNDRGHPLACGVYFLGTSAGADTDRGRLILLR